MHFSSNVRARTRGSWDERSKSNKSAENFEKFIEFLSSWVLKWALEEKPAEEEIVVEEHYPEVFSPLVLARRCTRQHSLEEDGHHSQNELDLGVHANSCRRWRKNPQSR